MLRKRAAATSVGLLDELLRRVREELRAAERTGVGREPSAADGAMLRRLEEGIGHVRDHAAQQQLLPSPAADDDTESDGVGVW